MEVNISRTARAADSGSREPTGAAPMTGDVPAGFFAERGLLGGLETVTMKMRAPNCSGVSRQLAQIVERLNHSVLRHVVHDLDFTDFLRKNEVHCSVAGLF